MKTHAVAVALLVLCASMSYAGNNGALGINYSVQEINGVDITAPNVNLRVGSASAGQVPAAAIAGNNYSVTTNGTGKKLVGSIDVALEENLRITANFEGIEGEDTSTGPQDLTTDPVDLVTGIGPRATHFTQCHFTLYADVAAGAVTPRTRVFTLTLTDGAQ